MPDPTKSILHEVNGRATSTRSFDPTAVSRKLPSARFCSASDLPSHRLPRVVSAMAYAQDLETGFSGTTFYLSLAGMATGKLEGMFSTYSSQQPSRVLQARGAAWKIGKMLTMQKRQGFKFTSSYVDHVWSRYIGALAGTTIISNFQLLGREFFRRRRDLGISAYFYVDGTLAEYFEEYKAYDTAGIASSTMAEAIRLEEEGYGEADGVMVMSRRSAEALRERYHVPPQKIAVVIPGANLPESDVNALSPEPAKETGDFVLGYVGLYAARKGLDRLAEATRILRNQGRRVRLRVIGNCSESLSGMDGVDVLGRIDKRTNTAAFLRALSKVHLGCLLSRAELAGIAAVEFLRLGIPVLGTDVGGTTDILEGGGTVMVDPRISAEELASIIGKLQDDKTAYDRLKTEASARRSWATWNRAVEEMDRFLT